MIVKGYNGIMDLDLTNVPVKLHKELIKQHHKDIKDYKLEQAKLPEKSRYENTVLIAQQKLKNLGSPTRTDTANLKDYDMKNKTGFVNQPCQV